MRRAAIHILRTARRTSVRKLLGSTTFRLSVPFQASSGRSISSRPRKNDTSYVLSSSMQLPRYSIAALLAAVGGGVWYYQDGRLSGVGGLVSRNRADSGKFQSATNQRPDAFTSTITQPGLSQQLVNSPSSEQGESPKRRTLIVDDDQFYAADLSEDIPLTKAAEDPSRQVLEMLTPGQATQTLRRNEESYLVGRGRGVVRYDVVQLPSNNPIEDDHAERIVEVPQEVASAQDGSSSSDWMFWGVFDGHRLVIYEQEFPNAL